MVTHAFQCSTCGKRHEGIPLAWGPDAPDSWSEIPETEREGRGSLTADTCVIDDQFYFVRGSLDIPIRAADDRFRWLVWVSVSGANFKQIWESPAAFADRPHSPVFGWLNTVLPYHVSTVNLKTNLHWRGRGKRPFVELEPTDHPLARQQREGIHLETAYEIAGRLLHEPTGGGA